MALMPWEPSESLATLQRERHRLCESFFDGSLLCGGEPMTKPAVEVADIKETVVVKAYVPGVSQEQLQVMVSEESLTIKGETTAEEKQEEQNSLRRECRSGAFSRTVPLSAAVPAEQATAQLKDGVLAITMPKSAEARVKAIPIQG